MSGKIRSLAAAAACSVTFFALPALAIQHATAPENDQTRDSLVASGTLVRIEMVQTISSAHNKKGDVFDFMVVDDVKAGSRLAIPAGTKGTGKVVAARPAHGGRANGALRVEFDPLVLADGTQVKLAITRESINADANEHNGMAGAVASIADVTVPGFFLIDLLRKGDDVTLAANAPFHVGVVEDAFLTGGR